MTGTPESSRAPTIARTSSRLNWCRLWWEPSRRQVSVSRMSRSDVGSVSRQVRVRALSSAGPAIDMSVTSEDRAGHALAGAGRGGGHDVQVAAVRREEVAGALDLEEH